MTQLLRPEASELRRADDATQPTLTDSQVLEFCKTGLHTLEGIIPDATNGWVFDYIEENCCTSNPLLTDVNALLKEQRFIEEVLLHPQVSGAVRSLLGAQYQLPDWVANHRLEGPRDARPWHIDAGSLFERRLKLLQIFYYPQEATPERGPTLFLPGSHLVPVARAELEHFGNLAGQMMTTAPAGTVFLSAYSIWHRQPAKKSTDVRNLLKWDAWRTTSPKRDWIVEADFDFATADYSYKNDYFCEAVQQWQFVLPTAELFMWLCGKSDQYRHTGGSSWPYSASDPGVEWTASDECIEQPLN